MQKIEEFEAKGMHKKVEAWKNEISDRILTIMKKLDSNRDGFITRDEFAPPNSKGHHQEL